MTEYLAGQTLSDKGRTIHQDTQSMHKLTRAFCNKKIPPSFSNKQVHKEIQDGIILTGELRKLEHQIKTLMHEVNANIIGGKIAAKSSSKALKEIQLAAVCMKTAIFTKCHILNLQFSEKNLTERRPQKKRLNKAMKENLSEAKTHLTKGSKLLVALLKSVQPVTTNVLGKIAHIFSKASEHLVKVVSANPEISARKKRKTQAHD